MLVHERNTGISTEVSEYEENVLKKMKNLETKSSFAENLYWLVTCLAAFIICVPLSTRMFASSVQQEIVESGQRTQLITVTVLLSVILMFGLVDKISDQTVGSLLGGIGGYVLSQGVGRQAANV